MEFSAQNPNRNRNSKNYHVEIVWHRVSVCECVCQIGNDFALPSLSIFICLAFGLCLQEATREKNDKNSLFHSRCLSRSLTFCYRLFHRHSIQFIIENVCSVYNSCLLGEDSKSHVCALCECIGMRD